MIHDDRPIGVFDSGVGGLTVVRAIMEKLPAENIVYIGDTARTPYGGRTPDTIRQFALEIITTLRKFGPRAIVVACNTMSAVAMDEIKAIAGSIPVIGVLEPTIRAAISKSKSKRIGVIGTRATVESRAYENVANLIDPQVSVSAIACPLFVPLVEEGMHDHPAAKLIAREYLAGFNGSNIDTLVLGCTHYPALRKVIADAIGSGIGIVDSAEPTAQDLKIIIGDQNGEHAKEAGTQKIFVTDMTPRVRTIAETLLRKDDVSIEYVHLNV